MSCDGPPHANDLKVLLIVCGAVGLFFLLVSIVILWTHRRRAKKANARRELSPAQFSSRHLRAAEEGDYNEMPLEAYARDRSSTQSSCEQLPPYSPPPLSYLPPAYFPTATNVVS